MTSNGQIHWAFNDISSYKTPDCTPMLSDFYGSQGYLTSSEVRPGTKLVDYSTLQQASDQEPPQVWNPPVWPLP